MHGCLTSALVWSEDKASVVHVERSEDVFAEVVFQRLPAELLDGFADPVEIDAVLPALARVAHERRLERGILALGDARHAGMLVVADHVLVPEVVREAGRVRQQMTQRDRSAGWTQTRRARGVESLQNLDAGQLRDTLSEWFVQTKAALLDQLHRRHGCHGLGHGRDPHHAVQRHGRVLADLALAECALVDDAVVVSCERNNAGRHACVDGALEHLVYATCNYHLSLPMVSPGCGSYPAQALNSCARRRGNSTRRT